MIKTGNDLKTNFVYKEGKKAPTQKFSVKFLQRLLTNVAGDVYSEAEIEKHCKEIYDSTMPTGERGGGIEIHVKNLYWFLMSAFESEGIHVGLNVEDTFTFNDVVLEDFARRTKAAYEVIKPWYGYIALEDSLPDVQRMIGNNLPFSHIFWVTFYSSELISKLGKEKVISVVEGVNKKLGGGVSIDELVDGGLMIKTGKIPGDSYSAERMVALEKGLFGSPCKYHEKT